MLSVGIKIVTVIYIFILAGIIGLADFGGTQNLVSLIGEIPYGDKTGHFCLMGMLSLLVNLVLQARSVQIWKVNYLLGSLIVLAIVIAEEFSQKFIGGRSFDLADLLFDFAGIILFGEIARRLIRRKTLES